MNVCDGAAPHHGSQRKRLSASPAPKVAPRVSHIVIIFIWLIAFALAVHLAIRAMKHRLWGRQERRRVLKSSREFRRHHHFDEKQQYWVRNVDQVPLIDDSVRDRRFYITFWGWLLFILWEA